MTCSSTILTPNGPHVATTSAMACHSIRNRKPNSLDTPTTLADVADAAVVPMRGEAVEPRVQAEEGGMAENLKAMMSL